MTTDDTDFTAAAEAILASLSTNARETLAQVDHGLRETVNDLVRIAGKRAGLLVTECLRGAEGAAFAGWSEYLRAVGALPAGDHEPDAVKAPAVSPDLTIMIGDALVDNTWAALQALDTALMHALDQCDDDQESALQPLVVGLRRTMKRFEGAQAPVVAGHWIVWPERRFVTAGQLVAWACDDVDNGLHNGPSPTTMAEAMAILIETGSVTLAKATPAKAR